MTLTRFCRSIHPSQPMTLPDISLTLRAWPLGCNWHGGMRGAGRVGAQPTHPTGRAAGFRAAWPSAGVDPLRTPARVLALTAMAWGLVTLFFIRPRTANYDQIPEGGYRHLIIAWDVSPSMQLDDGGFDMGKQKKRTRAQRGAKVLLSLFERIALDQVRISIVAFFTGGKPVVVDTHDLNVVKNILDDLPLDRAFDPGNECHLGVEVKLAKGWSRAAPRCWSSVTATRAGHRPARFPRRSTRYSSPAWAIPGAGYSSTYMSRQIHVLRQLARRLGGEYVDVNDVQIPTSQLAEVAEYASSTPAKRPPRDRPLRGHRRGAAGITARRPCVFWEPVAEWTN